MGVPSRSAGARSRAEALCLESQASLPYQGLCHFTSVKPSPPRVVLWPKLLPHPGFAAELEKGLVLTWADFSTFNFPACSVSQKKEPPLFVFLGHDSQHLLQTEPTITCQALCEEHQVMFSSSSSQRYDCAPSLGPTSSSGKGDDSHTRCGASAAITWSEHVKHSDPHRAHCRPPEWRLLQSSRPCCHFTGKQSEVLNSFFCLRTYNPELHVAKAHHFPPIAPPEEHDDQAPGPRKALPSVPRSQSPPQAAWAETLVYVGLAVRGPGPQILPHPLPVTYAPQPQLPL